MTVALDLASRSPSSRNGPLELIRTSYCKLVHDAMRQGFQ